MIKNFPETLRMGKPVSMLYNYKIVPISVFTLLFIDHNSLSSLNMAYLYNGTTDLLYVLTFSTPGISNWGRLRWK